MPRLHHSLSRVILLGSLLALVSARPASAQQPAAPLVVTTTADTVPPCPTTAVSLRCAIMQANTDGAGDTISFHIPATTPGCAGVPAVCTIRPATALPAVTARQTTIDGFTQPGSSANTQPWGHGDNAVLTIQLDGSAAGSSDGLDISGPRDTLQGVSITSFHGSGVALTSTGGRVQGTFIGVTPAGQGAGATQFAAVNVIQPKGPVGHDTIGGVTPAAANLFSDNQFGIYVNSGSGSVIAGNYIGTTAAGSAALANANTGVVMLTPNNTLGGTPPGAGNIISGNTGDGVLIAGTGTLVAGNRIGTNAAGTAGVGRGGTGNGSHGVDVFAARTIIRDNVISANGDTGVVLLGTGGNVLQGNKIGTTADGMHALGNGLHPSAIFMGQPINGTDGVVACVGPNTIGGTASGAGNVISGNGGDGISIVSGNNVVQGNTIGTNAAGTAALPNRVDGVGTQSDAFKGVGFCSQAPGNGGSNNTIGGTASGAGNVISGNAGNGVNLFLADNNVVQGNRIGTTAAGTAALGNGGDGVLVTSGCDESCQGSSNNTIGGTAAGAGNVIGGNTGNGVHIDGTGGGVSNTVQGNRIGTDTTGKVALGNGANGVLLDHGAVNDTVGGTASSAGNLIAHNSGSGVLVGASSGDTGTHSPITHNSIFANGGLGIDLAPQGTVNCTTSPPGPNDDTPCPVITRATTAQVNGTACASCTVEVYIATNEADDHGHGEGKVFLGSATAEAGGAWSLRLASGQVAAGQQVTASATTPGSFQVSAETSEFAANIAVGAARGS